MSLPSINFYTLWFPRYSPDKIFKLKVTRARSKVKSRSHHDITHLHILTNVPTKYQLPIPYGLRDTDRTNFFPLPIHSDTIGDNNTPTALKGCGVKKGGGGGGGEYLHILFTHGASSKDQYISDIQSF